MRLLLAIRVLLLLALLGCAALWLLRVVDDVSGPLLLLCPLVIFTYRWELHHTRSG